MIRGSLVLLLLAAPLQGSPAPQNTANRQVRTRLIDGLTGQAVPQVRYTFTGSALLDGLTGRGDNEGNDGGGDPVRIVLKTDGGKIEGIARLSGRGVARAFIVLAPKDRRVEQSFRTALAAEDGTYTISSIAPGEYDLFALDRNEDDDYLDEAFLQALLDRAISVTVQPRSSQSFEVPLQSIPRR